MSKNNVGSLYYEILLSPNGYRSGAAAIRKEDRDLQSHLVKAAKEGLSERDKIRAEAERASRHNWKKNADNPQERARIHRLIIDTAKRRLAAVADLERTARVKATLADKRARDKRNAATLEGMKKLVAKQKAINDKARAAKAKADARAAANMPKTGIAGLWGKFQGIAGKIGTVTLAVWPLVQVFKVLARVATAAFDAIGKMASLVDKFRMHSLKIATFMRGNVKAAARLTKEVEDYAMKTSLSVDAGLDMAASLLTLGVNASAVTARLKQFNSVAMGNTDSFKRIAKAYTDVLGAGVLKATEMRQFTENGVKMRIVLREMLTEEGRYTGNVDDMISKRLITAKDVGNALERIGEEFKGLDTAVGDTLSGAWENLTEQMASFVRHSDLAKGVTDDLVGLVKELEKLFSGIARDLEGIDVAVNAAVAPLRGMLVLLQGINRARAALQMGVDYFETGNPLATVEALEAEAKAKEDLNRMEQERAIRDDDERARKDKAMRDAAEAEMSYQKALFDLQDKRKRLSEEV